MLSEKKICSKKLVTCISTNNIEGFIKKFSIFFKAHRFDNTQTAINYIWGLVKCNKGKANLERMEEEVENSEYKIQEVRSRALPQIAVNGSLTYNPVLQTNVLDGAMFGQPGQSVQVAFGQKWTSGAGVSLSQAIFDRSDLSRAVFSKTKLEKADLRTANNYSIDPSANIVRKARFSTNGVAGLLDSFGICIED